MKKEKFLSRTLVLLVFLFLFTPRLEAVPIELNFLYSGATPGDTAPWLTADVSDRSGGGVLLLLDARNLTGTQFVGSWFFNLYNLSASTVVLPSFEAGYIPTALFAFSFSPSGGLGLGTSPLSGFEIEFNFASSNNGNGNRFTAGETLRVILSEVTASSFFPPPDAEGYLSAAHIQGISLDSSVDGSAWIAARSTTPPRPQPVPEPSTILFLALGLTVTAGFLRRRVS